MIVVTRFDVPEGETAFEADARLVLSTLSERPGFLRGRLGRCVDAPTTWAVVTEWDSVGSYRRGLSAYDVKLATAAVMAHSRDEPGAFEVIEALDVPQAAVTRPSGRAR